MQWTNGNGGAYGEDPYGGAGYAYAYGHDGYGHDGYGHEGYAVDTATLTGDPVQLAQWTQPHSTAWDAAHGDVLTVPAAEIDTQPTPFVQPESESDPVRPVFVDSSGRRQRLVLRAARLLVIPAGGYVALLISTMLGGPGISAPSSRSRTAHTGPARRDRLRLPVQHRPLGGSASSAAAHGKSRSTAQRTSGQPVRPTASTAPAATSGPTAAPTRATSPTATVGPTSTPSSRGRALGTSHKPVK
ncbi:hypothetical protein O1M54_23835 [Streptomyces diastatochromogenes]|nr:hypothetical protein [Streptomyces diastatochromogenes]